MTTEAFVRRPRLAPPRIPGGEVPLTPPPEVPRPVPGNLVAKIMPVILIVAVLGMLALFFTMGSSMMRNPFMMMFPLMMLVSMGGMLLSGRQNGGKRPAELDEDRKDYLRYLERTRREVGETAAAQRAALEWNHPEPAALLTSVGSRRMWERRPSDPDFVHVRLGVGSQRLATRLQRPETGPVEDLEPVSAVALRRFVRTHSVVHGLPVSLNLRAFPAVNIDGPAEDTRGLVRVMICELCTFHGPDDLRVAVVTGDPDAPQWSWAKWLPHLGHPTEVDGMGAERMFYTSLSALERSLEDEIADRSRFSRSATPDPDRPHLVVVIDDGFVDGTERLVGDAGYDGVTVLDLTAPEAGLAVRRGVQFVVSGRTLSARSASGTEEFATIDHFPVAQAQALARRLGRHQLASAARLVDLGADPTGASKGLMALLRIPDAAAIEPAQVWRPRTARERLRVPIGTSPDGRPVEIDIKEAAENGMGPHGLCIGATGSGKSEFLRTLVLSMVTTHSPDALNLVLVDFKGGATFLGLESLPHVSAVITNLEGEFDLVDRMKDALYGEMTRRQELLRAAGNFANVGDYERARAAGAALDPLPALFIVVDEFSELLTQKPDFAELFVAIGRLGRSLQMHLLLASQRLEEGKLRGLDSHLSYRIGLKTFSSSESRSVLGVVDAYHLPGTPGAGYLKTDSDDLTRFHAAYVSGPYEVPVIDDDDECTGPRQRVVEFTSVGVPLPELPEPAPDARGAPAAPAAPAGPAGAVGAAGVAETFGGTGVFAGLPSMADLLADSPPAPGTDPALGDGAATGVEHTPRSLLDVVVDRLRGHGRPAHEIWLPPLDEPESVDVLLGGPVREPVPADGVPTLAWPIGTVDKPFEQRRDPMTVELGGSAGNIAVAGGPQSGKSTALRTLIMSAAATHAPEHVQFFCVDLGGGSLAGLRDVPHVGYIAGRRDLDGIRRSVAELTTLLAEREARFRRLGVESMTDFRRLRAEYLALEPVQRPEHPLHGDRFGDVFLVIDGWATFRGEFEELVEKVSALTSGGLSYGIHVVVSVSRWAERRSTMRDFMGTRVELRLGDPAESEAGRVKGALVPEGRPGRGILKSGLHTLIGLPRLDGGSSVDDLAEGVRAAAADLQALYGDRAAPPVRLLADDIPRAAVLAEIEAAGSRIRPNRALLGIGENALQPVTLDFRTQPHFMAFADAGSGKTTVLRNIVESIVATTTPEEAKILLVDYRRSLLGVVPQDHLAGYISSAKSAHTLIPQLVPYFQNRLPGDDVTAEQLATRSWWTGPEVYVVVDDHDLVAPSPGSDPLSELHQFLPQARDVGLHIVLTRRMGGVSRAMFSGTIAKLRELSVDVLVMSGSRDEGNIVGKLKPSPLPPGRGTLVSRDTGTQMIQVCSVPPVVSSAPDQD